jgi:hypothetical protein
MIIDGLDSLESLQVDIAEDRPIVLIQVDDHRCLPGDLSYHVFLTITGTTDLSIACLH